MGSDIIMKRYTARNRRGTFTPAFVLVALLLLWTQSGQAAPTDQAKTKPKPATAAHAAGPAVLLYNRDIRPLLSENCFACHGPDKNKRQAGMRLDVRPDALAAGAFVPGKPDKSNLIQRIFSTDSTMVMPPVAFNKALTPAQKALLRRWIAEGAVYQQHWAYIPPQRPTVPKVQSPIFPVRNPIDAFILEPLAQKGITPSPQADKRTLIRRLSLDLIGLPPTPEEVRAFVNDSSPQAYDKLVARLLASPHYGERMAVPWLDVVRYADTVGFHGDQNQNAWAYRDYVINAFNTNKPFDQFTIEQLAGDLLPNPTPQQMTASCYNRLNMVTREGGAQVKEYLAKYAADRVRTVSMSFLGSTMGCCECHDHKYDPFTQRDFYSMGAFFADLKQWGIYADYGYNTDPGLRGLNNDTPFPPEVTVDSPYLQQRITRQRAKIGEVTLQTDAALKQDAAKAEFTKWLQVSTAFLKQHHTGWETPTIATTPGVVPAADTPPVFHQEADGRILLNGVPDKGVTLSVTPETPWIAALRLELLPDATVNSIFHKGAGGTTLTLSATLRHADGKTQAIPFRYAAANLYEPQYSNGFEILGVQGGWHIGTDHVADPHVSCWLPNRPVRVSPGDVLDVSLKTGGLGCIRLSEAPFEPQDPAHPDFPASLEASLAQPDAPADHPEVLHAYLGGTAWNEEAFAKVASLENDVFSCHEGRTPVMVSEAVPTPLVMRVLPRGNWQDESGAIVTPDTPHFLPGPRSTPEKRLTRLDLAHWIVSPQNPLTARVIVNRLWKQFYGNGLSGQVEDLGGQGEWPSHPELLDWLATEFRESGWNVKHMVTLMVTASAYRQKSSLRPELRDMDPNNRLLASQNPRRLEAEFVRDNALAISGLLNTDIGGPSCHPYQPAGYYVSIQFPNRDYYADTDDRQYRRGLYMHWQRTFMHPMLANFDAPSREDCVAARTVSNTPQQALTLLNDPSFVEAARVFAANTMHQNAGDMQRLEAIYQRALCRSIKPKEKQSMLAFLQSVRSAYHDRPDDATKLLKVGIAPVSTDLDPIELAAWTSVCRVVLNLHETITRY